MRPAQAVPVTFSEEGRHHLDILHCTPSVLSSSLLYLYYPYVNQHFGILSISCYTSSFAHLYPSGGRGHQRFTSILMRNYSIGLHPHCQPFPSSCVLTTYRSYSNSSRHFDHLGYDKRGVNQKTNCSSRRDSGNGQVIPREGTGKEEMTVTMPTPHVRLNEEFGVTGAGTPAQRPKHLGLSSLLYVVEPSHMNVSLTPCVASNRAGCTRLTPLPSSRTRIAIPRGSWRRYLRGTLLPWEWRLLVMGGGVGILLCAVGHLTVPWCFSILLDAACAGELPTGTSAQLVSLFGLVFVGEIIRWWCVGTCEAHLSSRLRKEMYHFIVTDHQWGQKGGGGGGGWWANSGGKGDGSALAEHDGAMDQKNLFSSSALVQRLTLDCQQVGESLTTGLSSLVYHLLLTTGAMIMMGYISFPLAYAVWGLAIPGFIFSGMYGRHFKASQLSCQNAKTSMKAVAEERLAWRDEIARWHTQQKESDWFGVVVDRYHRTLIRHHRLGAVYRATLHLVSYGACLCLMWAGGLLVASQRLTPGGLLAFLVYSMYAVWGSLGIARGVVHEVNRGYVAWLRLWEVVGMREMAGMEKMMMREEEKKKKTSCGSASAKEKKSGSEKEEMKSGREGEGRQNVETKGTEPGFPSTTTSSHSPLSPPSPPSSLSATSALLDVAFHHISYSRHASPFPLLRDVSCRLFPPSARPTQPGRPAVTCVVAENSAMLSAAAAVLQERCPPTLEQLNRCLVRDLEYTEKDEASGREKGGNAEKEEGMRSLHSTTRILGAEGDGGKEGRRGRLDAPFSSTDRGDHNDLTVYPEGRLLLMHGPPHPSTMFVNDDLWSSSSSSPLSGTEQSPAVELSTKWLFSYLGPVSTTVLLEGSVGDNILYGALDYPFGGVAAAPSSVTTFSTARAGGSSPKGVNERDRTASPSHTRRRKKTVMEMMMWMIRGGEGMREQNELGGSPLQGGIIMPVSRDPWRYAQVVEAAMKGAAHSFISQDLLHGYDTLVRGRKRPLSCSLSCPLFLPSSSSSSFSADSHYSHYSHLAVLTDGQIQLIGLSRALARRPAVLVLDQPTAGLDHSASYAMVASAIRHLCLPPEKKFSEGKSTSSSQSRFTSKKVGRGSDYPHGILLCSNDRTLVELAQHIILLGKNTSEGYGTAVAQGTFNEVKDHPVFYHAVR